MLNRLKDVFASFQRHDVQYVVIGGIASILHGVPRATFDLDILIRADHQNASCMLAALVEAGFATATIQVPKKSSPTKSPSLETGSALMSKPRHQD